MIHGPGRRRGFEEYGGSSGPSESKIKGKEGAFTPVRYLTQLERTQGFEREFENTCMPVRN